MVTPDGQRTMRAAGRTYFGYRVPTDIFQNRKLVHFEGYQLGCSDCTEPAMKDAKEAHALVSFDLSSFETVLANKEMMLRLLTNYVDVVFANEEEAFAITGLAPEEACLKLQSICPIAVVKLGERGCLVGHQGQVFSSPAFPNKVIDTLGAGDLFASGFLFGILNDYSLASCAKMGNRLGSAIIEFAGASLPDEKWAEIHEFVLLNF